MLPYRYSDYGLEVGLFTWAVLAIGFGFATLRIRSTKLLVGLAFAFVGAIVIGLVRFAPLLGWKYLIETP